MPHAVLAVMGLWAAWRPCETFASTPVVLAVALLVLVPWASRSTRSNNFRSGALAAAAVVGFAVASGLSGADPASAVLRLALTLTVGTLLWFGSRQPVDARTVRLFAFGLALLALWAIWQVTVGFERAHAAVPDLPLQMRLNAVQRLASGRAFASMVVPGHLAVVLATALPILIVGVRRRWNAAAWWAGCALCVIGLILTYSPVGIGLGLAASLVVLGRRRRWPGLVAAIALAVGLATAFLVRPDLAELDPVALRVDNWRTAGWVWSTSPIAGVGLGGYGQATQVVPFEVGNRPAHAHSLPLEWLAELGLVGVAAVIAVVWALIALIRRLWPVRPELAVAVAVVPLHNVVDFSLYTSGVAIPWALLAGWCWASVREPRGGGVGAGARLAVVTAAAVAVAVALLHTTSVVQGEASAGEERPEARFERAAAAHRFAPWRIAPVTACAVVALESGDRELTVEAYQILTASRWLRPRSASWAALASRLELARGAVPTAVSEGWTAADERPFEEVHQQHLSALLDRLTVTEHVSSR